MMALLRPALEGAGALAATRPPARRTAVRPVRTGRGRRGALGEGRVRAGAAAAAWRRALASAPVWRRRALPQPYGGTRGAAAKLRASEGRMVGVQDGRQRRGGAGADAWCLSAPSPACGAQHSLFP